MRLLEHGVGFPYARTSAEENLELPTARLMRVVTDHLQQLVGVRPILK
jgi:hypothetical protein